MSEEKRLEATIQVPSGKRKKRDEEEEEEEKDQKNEEPDSKKPENVQKAKELAKKKKEKEKEEELSEEDQQKKAELDLLVERVQDKDQGVQKLALTTLTTEIKTSTSSMTSVPKPLKFLRPHYEKLVKYFETMPNGENKNSLSDILSVLAMTMQKPGVRDVLKYKLSGSKDALGTWGHEYVRALAGEIGQEYSQRQTDEKPVDDLMKLVEEIVPYNVTHNAEHEACDLLIEVEQLEKIIPHCDSENYSRVCLYLTQCANYVPEPEDTNILKIVLEIYKRNLKWFNALRIAIKLGDISAMQEIYENCSDTSEKQQLAILLGRQHLWSVGPDSSGEIDYDLISNSKLSEYFLALAQDLKISEAKTPEDVYKSDLNETRGFSANIDSARQNLASTFVNAFVNCGFGNDKLMTEEGIKWIYKNKEHGMMSASASLGMILLWDVDGGLTQIDKYLYANEDYVKAGALLAFGVVSANVRNESDPALALLSDFVEAKNSNIMRIGAILGLGLAYSGSAKEELSQMLIPIVENSSNNIDVLSIAALSLGMVFVGTANVEITEAMTSVLMELDSKEVPLNNTYSRYFALGLGLLYLGKQEGCEPTLEVLKTLKHAIGKYASLTLETCAYAGTGNVLKVQKLLHICGDHLDEKNWAHQIVAVLGIALVSMGEEIGSEMAMRSFDHLLQYGEPIIRRGIPLALGLLSISYPRITVMDTLSKLSHDADEEVSLGAIFSLGLIGAGTNNSRVAGLLRNLAIYYYKEPNHLFMVRIAQGLVYLGKGTLSLAPYHSDRLLLSPIAMTGLLTVIHSCFDFKNIILGKSPHMLYCLSNAISPRMLMTFDEYMKPLQVSVRVGQAVDTIGLAGRPKTITGFQTHTTPVLLGFSDRAELATDEYIPLSPILEGFVILRKNPDYKPEEEERKK